MEPTARQKVDEMQETEVRATSESVVSMGSGLVQDLPLETMALGPLMAAQKVVVPHDSAEAGFPAWSASWTDEKVIGGQTVSDNEEEVVVPSEPVTVSLRWYGTAVLSVTAGSITGMLMVAGVTPARHGRVTGSPVTAGTTERVQLFDRSTAAVIVAGPPVWGSPSGVATDDVMVGGASATVTVTTLDLTVPPLPLAVSSNL
jgi:hypothetical protein